VVASAVLAAIVWRLLGRHRRRRSSRFLRRLLLSAIDLQRRPPGDGRAGVTTRRRALASLQRPQVPRALDFVTIKRTNPRFGTFGHWWIEVDGVESYGWWPGRCPLRMRHFLFGGSGALNGTGGACAGGNSYLDPHHRDAAEHEFHPVLTVRRSDRWVRARIRAYATAFDGGWRWSTKPHTVDCRTFQVRLMDAVGLVEPADQLASRGRGCPFLGLFRTRWRKLA
jgi:hypothetical protein